MLDITYKNRKIERICTNAKVADREYGSQMSAKIHMRIDEYDEIKKIIYDAINIECFERYLCKKINGDDRK